MATRSPRERPPTNRPTASPGWRPSLIIALTMAVVLAGIGSGVTKANAQAATTAKAGVPSVAAALAGQAPGVTYVAVGDSYSAGEGLGPYQPGTDNKTGNQRNQCHRSLHDAYPEVSPSVVLPGVLASDRKFWACSGAKVSDMQSVPPQTAYDAWVSGQSEQYGQPQQTAQVDTSTGWITASVGGDDLGFGDVGRACVQFLLNHSVVPLGQPKSCQQQLADSTRLMPRLLTDLAGLYTDLLTRAPSAKLVVVGYPRIFPAIYNGVPTFSGTPYCILDHYPVAVFQTIDVGLPVTSARLVDGFVIQLNRTIQNAISQLQASMPGIGGRIRYADTYTPATPRNCKGTTPNATVAGFELSGGHGLGAGIKSFVSSATFHPTRPGQLMFAHAVAGAFDQFVPLRITTADPPPFTVGQAIKFSLAATGGAPPYTFGISSAVPPWATAFTNGTLTGVITAGTWPITFQVQDATGTTATRTFTFSTNGTGGGVVTNYTGTGISLPYDIKVGHDGSMWFTNNGNNSIGRVTTAGTVTNYTGPGIDIPYNIAAGTDGAMWFTNHGTFPPGSIGRVSTAGTVSNFTAPGAAISTPYGIAAGPDGAMWFTNNNESIGRITSTGAVTDYTGPGINAPYDITAGPDGAIWFTNSGNNSIGRITTAGTITDYTDPGIGYPERIAAGVDGALWFVEGNGSIGRITTTGTVTSYTGQSITLPVAITAGRDGAMWFTDAGDNSIGRITTSGTVTKYADPSISVPGSIVVGPDGAMWFTNYGNNSIGRIKLP